jgi:hypothetical protein
MGCPVKFYLDVSLPTPTRSHQADSCVSGPSSMSVT